MSVAWVSSDPGLLTEPRREPRRKNGAWGTH